MTVAIPTQYSRDTALDIFGILMRQPDDPVPAECETILLLGPREPGFWQTFSTSPEYLDGGPDSLDRWSKRVIEDMAKGLDGVAIFPSDGPPYAPFFQWALRTERTWKSPVSLLVHDQAGLWVSFRGAIALPYTIKQPESAVSPCITCKKPCTSACPVGALTPSGYDLDRCHTYLDSPTGKDCMTKGCAVRRACPVSQSHGRMEVQSAFHMKSFHPE